MNLQLGPVITCFFFFLACVLVCGQSDPTSDEYTEKASGKYTNPTSGVTSDDNTGLTPTSGVTSDEYTDSSSSFTGVTTEYTATDTNCLFSKSNSLKTCWSTYYDSLRHYTEWVDWSHASVYHEFNPSRSKLDSYHMSFVRSGNTTIDIEWDRFPRWTTDLKFNTHNEYNFFSTKICGKTFDNHNVTFSFNASADSKRSRAPGLVQVNVKTSFDSEPVSMVLESYQPGNPKVSIQGKYTVLTFPNRSDDEKARKVLGISKKTYFKIGKDTIHISANSSFNFFYGITFEEELLDPIVRKKERGGGGGGGRWSRGFKLLNKLLKKRMSFLE